MSSFLPPRWSGGFESQHEIRRAVGKFEQLESADAIRDRIVKLKQQGYSHATVAPQLNHESYQAAGGGSFTAPIISQLCRKFRAEGLLHGTEEILPPHWILGKLARQLG